MVTVYVEGGGNTKALRSECRLAFQRLFLKSGFRVRAVAMGGRDAAFKAFGNRLRKPVSGEFSMLLVDSETIPTTSDAWMHLKSQDRWRKPTLATNDQAQLMVACMETWLISDANMLATYFGPNFKAQKIPTTSLETRSKRDVYLAIRTATAAAAPKGAYGKARDSFKLVAQIDPRILRASCKWAERLFNTLERHR